jgi:hypothetical protein
MSKDEQDLFLKYVSKARIYLEFGSGGSTVAALKFSKAKVFSVDSSQQWFDGLCQKYEIIDQAQKNKRLVFNYCNIGKTGDWGVPINDEGHSHYPNYSQKVFANDEAKNADVFLIDGRFRLACAFACLKTAKQGAVFIIHDFWDRQYYHDILKFVNILDRADTLGVFCAKQNLDNLELDGFYEKYKYVVS